jgi:hypothetical protein
MEALFLLQRGQNDANQLVISTEAHFRIFENNLKLIKESRKKMIR